MIHRFFKKNIIEVFLVVFALAFSFWIMFHTFSYSDGTMYIATKAWSDFASHIPLIRSFSLGDNLPPEFPLFPGEPIRYHFLFYALLGFLERLGLRIDLALNIPSALSFAALILMIYFFAKTLFKSKAVGVLSVVFFLFNGSLSFLEFFKNHPLSFNSINDVLANSTFPSFGPYDGKLVSAFWNLNIFTNQRHLAITFALALFVIYLLYTNEGGYTKKKLFMVAFVTGLLLLINKVGFAIVLVFLAWLLIIKPRLRLLLGIIFALEVFLFFAVSAITHSSEYITFKVGFLLPEPITLQRLITYWFFNWGLYSIFIPLGFLISPKNTKKFIVPLVILFGVANTFRLSTDIINNHKFFNFFLIFGSMCTAYLLVFLWHKSNRGIFVIGRVVSIVFIIFLTLSGIIDFMAIKNDSRILVRDLPINKDAQFIKQYVDSKAIILNSTFLYHPASLAGRPIFYGYPYFLWSYGYNTRAREEVFLEIYRTSKKEEACQKLKLYNISYVELSERPEEFIQPNRNLWETQFRSIYKNPTTGFTLYDVRASCKDLSNRLNELLTTRKKNL